MKNLKSNIYLKIGIIIATIFILIIPIQMIMSLISERELIHADATQEVCEKWGGSQRIIGPYITIPYDRYVKVKSLKDSVEKIHKYREWLHILPANLKIEGNISPEIRYRGIYEIVVYESEVNISGYFNPSYINNFNLNNKDIHIHFDKATLNIGISDLKGIEKQIALDWNNHKSVFNSGTITNDIVSSGINSSILYSDDDSTKQYFNLDINLKGSQNILFVPFGKTTDVIIKSDWSNPSFYGEFLPDSRDIDENGFEAKWNILHLNRNYPQSWIGKGYAVDESSFGVNLLLPVDRYQKTMRVAKYAILFIGLTFTVFFFVEVLNKVFIHPIQYFLVGISLVVFYSLLLSMSERVIFNLSYLTSALSTIILISLYVLAVLKSKKIALLLSGILSVTFGFIFIIIQLQDYALLIGSIGIFIILALVMYFSRKIDWYGIKLGEKTE